MAENEFDLTGFIEGGGLTDTAVSYLLDAVDNASDQDKMTWLVAGDKRIAAIVPVDAGEREEKRYSEESTYTGEYPEHEKMRRLRPQIDAVTKFLEALEQGQVTAGIGDRLHFGIYWREGSPRFVAASVSIPQLLAQHFGIDQDKIEAEKRQMLEKLRETGKYIRETDKHIEQLGRQVQDKERLCPDEGTCHHRCSPGSCFRVHNAGPLSGRYPGDEWPATVKASYGDGGML